MIPCRPALAAIFVGSIILSGCGGSSKKTATATPTFTPASGTYTSSQTVTVADATSGAVLYCTTDGSAPTASSPQCAEPVTVSKSETLSAIAVSPGDSPSAAASAKSSIHLPAAATPSFAPSPSQTYTTAQSVTITDTTTGATIYYTTDGSTPTTSSTVYLAAIMVSASETIKAIAAAPSYNDSPVATAAYTISLPDAAPVISSSAGASVTYPATLPVTITDTDKNAAIYYTTDGSAPSVTSPKYNGPITVAKTETINAVAVDTGGGFSESAPATQTFTIADATPVISSTGSQIQAGATVSITDADPKATISYTTDGSNPTTSGTAKTYSGPITISASETINASASDTAAGYGASAVATTALTTLPQAATPTISPAAGVIASGQKVTITSSAGATIYYTTDGSTPSATHGTQYTAPFAVTAAETVEAIAAGASFSPSNVASAAYTIATTDLPPVFSPAAGAVPSGQQVTITDPSQGVTIYYTLDGTTPSATHGTQYTAPITITAAVTIEAIATGGGLNASTVATAAYTIAAAASPVFSPAAGAIPSGQQVTITDASSGVTIYYTIDGSTPSSTHGTAYAGPITVNTAETIQAIATGGGFTPSPVVSAAYTIATTVATPTFTPAAGTFASAQTVSISDSTSGASIFYTLDGSTPSASSTPYTGPITVSSTETISAIATSPTLPASSVAAATYTILTGPAIVGTVSSGSMPIQGATVQLYASGSTGYGQGATSLSTPAGGVTTSANGSFALSYTCPAAPGDLVYLVATGGTLTTGGAANPGIALIAALGKCASLSSIPNVVVNEVTTIASAYSLQQFMAPSSSGGSGAASVIIGSSSTNYQGLANAFGTVTNLVDLTKGTSLQITPFYSGNDSRNPTGWSSTYGDTTTISSNNTVPAPFLNTSTVPYMRINTLAGILASCVEATASSACSALFSAATPPSGTAPTDTLQTALAIAQNPGAGVAGLFGLLPATPPYTPALTAAPNDFTLALTFTGGGLGIDPSLDSNDWLQNFGLAVDAMGNIWTNAAPGNMTFTPDSFYGLVAGFNSKGEALTPATSTPAAGGTAIFQDQATNLEYITYGGWGPNVIDPESEWNNAPQSNWSLGLYLDGGIALAYSAMAIDPSSQSIWATDFNSSNTYYPGSQTNITGSTPGNVSTNNLSLGYFPSDSTQPQLDNASSVVFDASGNLWMGAAANSPGSSLTEVTPERNIRRRTDAGQHLQHRK